MVAGAGPPGGIEVEEAFVPVVLIDAPVGAVVALVEERGGGPQQQVVAAFGVAVQVLPVVADLGRAEQLPEAEAVVVRVVDLALVIFVLASIGCVLSTGATELLVFRFLQGIGGSIGDLFLAGILPGLLVAGEAYVELCRADAAALGAAFLPLAGSHVAPLLGRGAPAVAAAAAQWLDTPVGGTSVPMPLAEQHRD